MRPEIRKRNGEWQATWTTDSGEHMAGGDWEFVLREANEAVIDWRFASIVEIGACS